MKLTGDDFRAALPDLVVRGAIVSDNSELRDAVAARANELLAERLVDAGQVDLEWDPRWSDEQIDHHLHGPWDPRQWVCRQYFELLREEKR